ncbi:MAG: hypothetical protein IPM42_02420 [Saprospiraceae bacterium]|nr:hypothetical protein [Saprospiraceae bacterium]
MYLLISICSIIQVTVSTLDAQYSHLQFKHITVEDGLAQSVVNAIFKDSHGFVWFATYSGISRYDGINVLSNDEIAPGAGSISQSQSIIEDSKGNIWFGAMEALIKFDYSTNRFYRYTRNELKSTGKEVTEGYYNPIAERNGGIFFTTNSYPIYYVFDSNDETFNKFHISVDPITKNILPSIIPPEVECFKDIFTYIWSDEENGTAITTLQETPENGLHWKTNFIKVKYGTVINVSKENNLIHIIFTYYPTSYCKTCFEKSILVTYDTKLEKIISDFNTDYSIQHLAFFEDKIFIASNSSGIHVIDQKTMKEIGNIRHQPESPTSLMSDNSAFVAIIDQQLWISSWGHGVDFTPISKPLFTQHFSKSEAKANHTDNFVRGIVEDDNGYFWCNTLEHGIVQMDQSLKFQNTIKGTEKVGSATIGICKDQNIFFGNAGLLKYNTKKNLLEKINHQNNNLKNVLSANEFHYFTLNKTGQPLFATMWGIYSIDSTDNQLKQIFCNAFEFDELQQFVYKDRYNNLYAFSISYGLNVFEEKSGVLQKKYSFKTEFIPRHAFEQNDSIVWFGTSSGLMKYNSKNDTEKWFTKSDGLPDNTVYAIAPDDCNRLWLSTNRGIVSMDLSTGKFKSYEDYPGQQGREYNRHAVCVAKDGRILFGGINGITAVYPQYAEKNAIKPSIQFTSIQNDIEINPFGHQNESESKILPAGTTFIEFHFIAIEFLRSKNCQLKYFLQGADKSWRTLQNPGNARYVNLLPGKYVFKVMASDYDGNWTNEIKTFHFQIKKYWWQTLLFKIIMFAIVVSLIYLLIKLWLNQKFQAEKLQLEKQLAILKEQERISADLHDDIGSTLSSISIYSELADKYYHTVPEKSQEMVQKISKQSKELTSRIEEIIWSLKPFQANKNTFEIKINEFINDSLTGKDIKCKVNIDDNLDSLISNAIMRKNILMIIKESLNNISKYSNASEVNIDMIFDKKNINLTISDDGTGFDTENHRNGNGLFNMKKRVKDMFGVFTVTASPGSGTTIQCRLPLN